MRLGVAMTKNCMRLRAEDRTAIRQCCPGGVIARHDWLVYWRWSPQLIAARLRRMYLGDRNHSVSHETIYAAIYARPRGGLKEAMFEAQRHEKSTHASAYEHCPS
jgi:hypothetical protein